MMEGMNYLEDNSPVFNNPEPEVFVGAVNR